VGNGYGDGRGVRKGGCGGGSGGFYDLFLLNLKQHGKGECVDEQLMRTKSYSVIHDGNENIIKENKRKVVFLFEYYDSLNNYCYYSNEGFEKRCNLFEWMLLICCAFGWNIKRFSGMCD
jgi:hypothetical protein